MGEFCATRPRQALVPSFAPFSHVVHASAWIFDPSLKAELRTAAETQPRGTRMDTDSCSPFAKFVVPATVLVGHFLSAKVLAAPVPTSSVMSNAAGLAGDSRKGGSRHHDRRTLKRGHQTAPARSPAFRLAFHPGSRVALRAPLTPSRHSPILWAVESPPPQVNKSGSAKDR